MNVCPEIVNVVYNHLPESWLAYLLAHQVLGAGSIPFDWMVRLRNQREVSLHVDPRDRLATGFAFEYKAHDAGLKRVQEFFMDRAGERTLYLDIGANMGVSSVYALSLGVRCWLFEPNTELHAFGRKLFAQNGYTTARWESVALSERAGNAAFYLSKSSFLSSFDRVNAAFEGEARELEVPLRTLDSYLPEIEASTTALIIKIDVEGHELPVLKGGRKVIEKWHPPVMLELSSSADARNAAWQYFEELDFECFGILDRDMMALQSMKSVAQLLSFDGINFLFLPRNHELRAELRRVGVSDA